jgi:2,5-diamino-6-(ribosylamino)-4(3H)-pyrimidinone 5'-phosphate reductase
MKPKVITHNAVSLDGSISGFQLDLEKYYKIVGSYHPDAMLVGSATAKAGIEMYTDSIPEESAADFIKPPRIATGAELPYWVIPDNNGMLQGRLHVFRRSGYCKDVIILLSERSPDSYAKYLLERNYETIITGHEDVDLNRSLELLHDKYSCKTVVTDSGGNLNKALLEKGLVDEISLLVSPILVDQKYPKLFRNLELTIRPIQLELIAATPMDGQVLLLYKVDIK